MAEAGRIVTGFKAAAALFEVTGERLYAPFLVRHFEKDNTYQIFTVEGQVRNIYLEHLEQCANGWRVVNRNSPPANDAHAKCPPVISGPHDTLEAGKAAYLVALATL